MHAIRRPPRIFVAAHPFRQLNGLALDDVHDEDVEISRLIAARPGEGDELAVGAPGRIGDVAFSGGEHLGSAAVEVHAPELLTAGAAGDEKDFVAGFWIHSRRDFDEAVARDALKVAAVHVSDTDLRR